MKKFITSGPGLKFIKKKSCSTQLSMKSQLLKSLKTKMLKNKYFLNAFELSDVVFIMLNKC